ncbi:hypothetical protein Taro_026022 [Colocasia esculenta]|uniref:non-specific serine/threonine protein kinase n=1 Tax=Colocasia esculenta TaxID=4460 RepID=A0A843VAW6_COLES|nr:hypothetical protein [Colocasia esculenta]
MGGGGGCPSATGALFFYLLCCAAFIPSSLSAVDFLFNSFRPGDLNLVGDARMDNTAIRLTNDSNRFSYGRAFYPTRLTLLRNATTTGGGVEVFSFSTSFVFSVLPEISSSPGFGLAFVLSASTSPPGFLAGQYFGLFSNSTHRRHAPLLAVEFDTGQNPEFADPDGNHVGIDLNYIESSATAAAGYNRTMSSGGREEFVPIDMRSGRNVRAWIDFDGPRRRIEVTLAPAEVTQKPPRPLLSYTDPEIPSYLAEEMLVGFSASKTQWVEAQRVLAWSLRDGGLPAREINTTGLPNFSAASPTSSSSTSAGLIAGVSSAAAALVIVFAGIGYYFCRRRRRGGDEEEEVEEWELKFRPHRFSYAELREATKGFAAERLLGFGGFGKVYKGVLPKDKADASGEGGGPGEEEAVAVKCMSNDSKQGLTEFMAEISSMGRLRHKNLVHMTGWCRKGTELMLVYDYMPNGSLDRWIFPGRGGGQVLGWEARRRVLGDVAEGLQYLHHGWDQVVLHRDVKCSNILLDAGIRGRLGDFGLARLHQHGEAPSSTRVVGTLGYLAPELARLPAPTAASDVYSFGVVVLEVACGRRPIVQAEHSEEDELLVEWVRGLYAAGRVLEAADGRVDGEYRAEDMELVLKLGLACCHPDPAQRPSMKEVVSMLLGDSGQQQQQQRPEVNAAPPPPPPGSEASSCTALMDGTSEEEQA